MTAAHLLTPVLAARFAEAALGHVTREYPNHVMHVLAGPDDARTPRELHPVFYGSYDWHSCVHGWWTLMTLRRLFPDSETARRTTALADSVFTREAVAGEMAYLNRADRKSFERPYGWAWLLALQAEFERHEDAAGHRWAAALRPLADVFVERFRAFLPLADYPVRVGTHYNTAFALRLTLDYAEDRDPDLATQCREAALRWHVDDRDCQAWEPSQDEFLSPALMEGALMRRVLDRSEFYAWFDAFLPRLTIGEPATLLEPARVSDRTDGKIAHLDGLNLSRAWCWREIASPLPDGDPRRRVAVLAAERHLAVALPHVTGDYMGEHWLASFALLALLAD